MNFILECRKIKRTGFVIAFIVCAIAAAAVPVLNMAVRSEQYTVLQEGSPIRILLAANWQMMAMLNILLIVVGACMIYHAEYADHAIQKMRMLPIKESGLFFGKLVLMALMCVVVLIIEAAGISFCSYYWFEPAKAVEMELVKSFGYALLMMLPAILTALLIASACENMWISLGISVICVFVATMLPADHFALALFPFALPFQTFTGAAESTVRNFVIAAAAESVGLSAAELLLIKVRRLFA